MAAKSVGRMYGTVGNTVATYTKSSSTYQERFIIIYRRDGSATERFEVGSWKTLVFRETLDKKLGHVQAGVVTVVGF
jgi:hypothetical protein